MQPAICKIKRDVNFLTNWIILTINQKVQLPSTWMTGILLLTTPHAAAHSDHDHSEVSIDKVNDKELDRFEQKRHILATPNDSATKEGVTEQVIHCHCCFVHTVLQSYRGRCFGARSANLGHFYQ